MHVAFLRTTGVIAVVGAAAGMTLLPGTGPADGAVGPETHQERRCTDPAHRQFDFWVGHWKVADPDGQEVGTNRITRILDGCVLREEYEGSGGYAGTSLNIYDSSAERWHQTWVDTGGLLLQLDGGMEDGRMVLAGDRVDREGRPVRDRIAWEPLEDGRVRQTWEVSRDGGETWETIFEGLYTPIE